MIYRFTISLVYLSIIIPAYLFYLYMVLMIPIYPCNDVGHVYDEIKTDDNDDGDSSGPIRHHAKCISQGVRSKIYKKLLDRDTCGKYLNIQSISPPVYMSSFLFFYMFIYLLLLMFTCRSVVLFTFLLINLIKYLSVHLFTCLPD